MPRNRDAHQTPAPETPDTRPPSHGPCVSRCNRRWREAAAVYGTALARWINEGAHGAQPRPPEIEPWPGEPIYCRKCAAVIRGALRELPLAYRALASTKYLTRTASADEEHNRGRSDVTPSPSPGADHQDEICRTAAAWEDDLRRHLAHQTAADTGDREADLAATVEYLNTNYQTMIGRPECAADFGAEIWRLHAVALAMVKNKPVRRFLPPPCPTCDVVALVQEEGIAGKPWYVECSERIGGCGRLFTESEFEWLTQLLTNGHVRSAVST
jgi:hypothetical protein